MALAPVVMARLVRATYSSIKPDEKARTIGVTTSARNG
jgi:hypothetical protein